MLQHCYALLRAAVASELHTICICARQPALNVCSTPATGVTACRSAMHCPVPLSHVKNRIHSNVLSFICTSGSQGMHSHYSDVSRHTHCYANLTKFRAIRIVCASTLCLALQCCSSRSKTISTSIQYCPLI
jgi:hypothetical protein